MDNTINKVSPKKGVFWFRHDLRINDNPAFNTLCHCVDELLCVFIVDPAWFKENSFKAKHIDDNRLRFLQESLACLHQSLALKNQKLFILQGDSVTELSLIIENLKPVAVGCNHHPGVYEKLQLNHLQQKYDSVNFISSDCHYLFNKNDFSFTLDDLPKTFTPFRKLTEKLNISAPYEPAKILPAAVKIKFDNAFVVKQHHDITSHRFIGGEEVAMKQLNYYLFETHHIKNYKHTRNGLDGWDYSSKLSAWLANGCISVHQVYHQLKKYEVEYGANESTYWLYFELLWREYFQWYLTCHRAKLFCFSGIQGIFPKAEFNEQRFKQWCRGDTEQPIINAFIKQLNTTGYVSNRGRQLLASYFVHQLNLDWRYGAAYFEEKLLDFDVANNWGNWQYLAGVGADPRGHRQFNIVKQTQQYDAAGKFQQKWLADDNK